MAHMSYVLLCGGGASLLPRHPKDALMRFRVYRNRFPSPVKV